MKNLIIKQLKKIKSMMLRIAQKIDLYFIPLFAGSGFLASFYYTFFNRSFYREHTSVLQGRLRYDDSLTDIRESSVLLRRNVHRLEKGLIMRPRRALFAQGYIAETVDCYLRCHHRGSVERREMTWAKDVLQEYFQVVSANDASVARAKRDFEAVSTPDQQASGSKPYAHNKLPPAPIDYPDLLTLFKRRRSVRWYQDKPVPRALIEQAVNAASLAPSACNRQPYRFEVFAENGQASEIAALAMGTAGFSGQLPCVFAVIGDLSCYPKERDRHVIYIDASLASMQLMLALETLGLSSCPINWPDIEAREKKMAKRLGLHQHERVIMLIATGYADPDGGIPFSQKKSATNLLKLKLLEPSVLAVNA